MVRVVNDDALSNAKSLILKTVLGIVYEVAVFPLGYLINSVLFLLKTTPPTEL